MNKVFRVLGETLFAPPRVDGRFPRRCCCDSSTLLRGRSRRMIDAEIIAGRVERGGPARLGLLLLLPLVIPPFSYPVLEYRPR